MSYQKPNDITHDKDLIFAEYFSSEQSVRRNGGVLTSITFDKGKAVYGGAGSKIVNSTFSKVEIFSVRIILTPDNYIADAYLFDCRGTGQTGEGWAYIDKDDLSLQVSNGTTYLDGETAPVGPIAEAKGEIVITGIVIDAVDLYIGAKALDGSGALDGSIELIEIYSGELTAEEVQTFYNDARYKVPQLNTVDHSVILNVNSRSGVVLEKTDQNTITVTNVPFFKDGSVRVMDFNGVSSLIESTLADDVNTIIFWAKPKTADKSIIDLGGGDTVTIASGVLTAAWADDLYVNGEAGTAIQHAFWNMVVCRVDTALVLTDIDIGKISAVFYEGLLDGVIFIDGIVTDAEISQYYSSTKHLYAK